MTSSSPSSSSSSSSRYHPPETSSETNFVIAGAGIAGLATGLGLSLTGQQVTILEQASTLEEAGAGIQVAPNASRILARLGVLDEVMKDADVLERVSIRRYADDKQLGLAPIMPNASHRYGSPALVIHRSDLHRILLSSARKAGCRILTSRRVVSVQDNTNNNNSTGKPRVQTEDGEWHEADVILGADGVRSVVRAHVVGHQVPLTPTGDAAYRLLIPRERMAGHETLGALVEGGDATRWVGPRGHIMGYPILRRPKSAVVTFCHNWSRPVRDLVSCAPEGQVTEWLLRTHPPLPRWTRHRVALVGDACHPMLPYMAQGAACAIEDAGALVAAFVCAPDPDAALHLYERVRKPQSESVQEASASQRECLHLPDGIHQVRRDDAIRRALEPSAHHHVRNPDLWLDRSWQDSVWGSDVVEDIFQAASSPAAGERGG
ncbi:hypothetical protein L249_1473 [Ophiocordyceps polyrhachis-furcata BCC 54312]|uniref:FAD-binding domain-containing protein n=1 Tax=Ophiocordyceps polyrhachis-furcata BCC 54312 TaxID=1330021 RepID=A0A367L4E4_9HYPO|nr:hypothetical protein L249_1473 [Ophiocordyceps polyrhachis-furcata BCC 54312]